jgi:enamine deaminase RidA (YjgF/YER057c/UK114 family)
MPVKKINIPTLPEPQGFTHIAVASGSRVVFLAGQVSQDSDGNVVGEGDLAAQMEQAMLNVAAGLEAAGATVDDVAKTTLYVVDWEHSKLEQLFAGFGRAAERIGTASTAPVTLVPVPRLFEDGHLIEIEVTAVLD